MQPQELKKVFDFEIGPKPRNLELLIQDCASALYHQVRTGKWKKKNFFLCRHNLRIVKVSMYGLVELTVPYDIRPTIISILWPLLYFISIGPIANTQASTLALFFAVVVSIRVRIKYYIPHWSDTELNATTATSIVKATAEADLKWKHTKWMWKGPNLCVLIFAGRLNGTITRCVDFAVLPVSVCVWCTSGQQW